MKVDSVQEFCKRQVNPIQSFQKEKQDAHAYDWRRFHMHDMSVNLAQLKLH